jgi:phosphosulfolactate synthase (CoM biosynthesis protein A)
MNEQKHIKPIKPHTTINLTIKFKNKNKKISNETVKIISKGIIKYTKNIIFEARDMYIFKGKIELYYEIYNDKINEFIKKIPEIEFLSNSSIGIDKIILKDENKKFTEVFMIN